jgi:general secretion pathway protein A
MYCDFYGFRESPFTITPNPRFIFLSKNHKEAFAHLLYGIRNHGGFIALTGEVGTGKTTVLRTLLGQLDETNHRTALIFNPCLSALELLSSINREFGIDCQSTSSAELLNALNQFLLRQNTEGHTVVLVIDEAQNLETQVLEQIRLISNLETETAKLIQIVLAGQPELTRVLEQQQLRQLNQRITVRYHLRPMDFDDTIAYIGHRLAIAGSRGAVLFTPSALKRIFRYSGGLPRLINILCDRVLLIGYTEERREITERLVKTAISEIRQQGKPRRLRLGWWLAPLLLLVALAGSFPYLADKNWFAATTRTVQATLASASRPAELAPDQNNPPVETGALVRELAGTSEADSARQAFNVLAKLWQVEALAGVSEMAGQAGLERLATQHQLRLVRFSGNLGALLRMDTPAILELTIPGSSGRRYLALTGTDHGRLLIAPPLLGRSSISSAELESFWGGRGYLPWRNFLKVPPLTVPGANGAGVRRLQQLLVAAGYYAGEPNGVYDAKTSAAVRKFQADRGITADGRVGEQTLLLLYQRGGDFAPPRLAKKGES